MIVRSLFLYMDLKKIKINVVNKDYKKLAPTNMLIANTLVAREKAIWIVEGTTLMLLKTKEDFKELKKIIIKEEDRICYICNNKIPKSENATIDHVNPKSKFGTDDRENLHCCCKRCNDDKGNLTYDEYINHVKKNPSKYKYLDIKNL